MAGWFAGASWGFASAAPPGEALAAWLAAAVVAAAGAAWSVRAFPRRGWVQRNYAGRLLPLGVGWALVAGGVLGGVIAVLGGAAAGRAATPWDVLGGPIGGGATGALPVWVWCGGALLLAALGWLDDRLGSAREKGLRGHLRALFHGRVTTGVWKLAGGGAFALAAAAAARPPRDAASTVAWLADALLVALSINTLNALDLRPGRALKGWLLLVGLAWLLGARSPWLPAFLAAAVGFAPWDLRARAMMGDTGANALGAVAGLAWLAVPDAGARVGVLLALGLFHVWIERRSLTAWIEEHTWARWLDRLGRPPER